MCGAKWYNSQNQSAITPRVALQTGKSIVAHCRITCVSWLSHFTSTSNKRLKYGINAVKLGLYVINDN